MSTGPQMGRPAGLRGGRGFTVEQEEEVEKSAAVCLDKTSGREGGRDGRVSLGKNPTAEKKKKKKKVKKCFML